MPKQELSQNLFVALYRGETVSSARLIAATTDPAIVALVAAEVLRDPKGLPAPNPSKDDIEAALRRLLAGQQEGGEPCPE